MPSHEHRSPETQPHSEQLTDAETRELQLRGEGNVELLHTNPHIPHMPLYESEVVSQSPTATTDDVTHYKQVGEVYPLYVIGEMQVSIGNDGQLYQGSGKASDLYRRRDTGSPKVHKPSPYKQAAYDLEKMTPRHALTTIRSGKFTQQVARLVRTPEGEFAPDLITQLREKECQQAEQDKTRRRETAQVEKTARDEAAAARAQAHQDELQRQAEHKRELQQLLGDLTLPLVIALAQTDAASNDNGKGAARLPIETNIRRMNPRNQPDTTEQPETIAHYEKRITELAAGYRLTTEQFQLIADAIASHTSGDDAYTYDLGHNNAGYHILAACTGTSDPQQRRHERILATAKEHAHAPEMDSPLAAELRPYMQAAIQAIRGGRPSSVQIPINVENPSAVRRFFGMEEGPSRLKRFFRIGSSGKNPWYTRAHNICATITHLAPDYPDYRFETEPYIGHGLEAGSAMRHPVDTMRDIVDSHVMLTATAINPQTAPQPRHSRVAPHDTARMPAVTEESTPRPPSR